MLTARAMASFVLVAWLSSCGHDDSQQPRSMGGGGGGGQAGGGAGGHSEGGGDGERTGGAGGTGSPDPMPACGDGVIDDGEACDDGPANGASYVAAQDAQNLGCTRTCERPHYCGDRHVDVDVGEQCDFGPDNGRYIDRGAAKCVVCDADCLIVASERCYWPGDFPPPSTP